MFPLSWLSMFQPFFTKKVILFNWRLVSIFSAGVVLWTAAARDWKNSASASAKWWQLWQRIQAILLLSALPHFSFIHAAVSQAQIFRSLQNVLTNHALHHLSKRWSPLETFFKLKLKLKGKQMFAEIYLSLTDVIYVSKSITQLHLAFQVVDKLTNIVSAPCLPLLYVFMFGVSFCYDKK